mgnify:CR=1 FL=1
MATPIDFYFDFSSPYGYIGAEKIDALAAKYGRTVNWHVILLGVIFKTTGGAPLPSIPLKGDYAMRDFPRLARYHGLPFSQPANFPIATHNAARTFLWLRQQDEQLARNFALACYRAYFAEGIDISDLGKVLNIAASLGVDADALSAALNDEAVKELLKTEVEAAMQRGVFGSPFFIVDNEPFWGSDRMPQLEKWLETGGF